MRIDLWTLGLQTINVLILIWILSKFLFRPVVAIIEERRRAAQKLLDDAEAAKREAVAARERAEAEAARIAAARDEVLRHAAQEAEAQRAGALAAAREEADQLRDAAETDARSFRLAEEASASDRSAKLAVDIGGKLLARLPEEARVAGFIDGLAQALASLPETTRRGVGADGKARLCAPRPLNAEETQACRHALERALGRPVDFTILVDPSLIAGLELETPHAVVRNSFRADLSRILEELTRHDAV